MTSHLVERMLAAVAAIFALHGAAAPAEGDDIYRRPGRLVAAGDGARLNLHCTGDGSPVVVFESGWEDWAPVWAMVQPRVAQWTRACSYDRAGTGFSEPGPMPRTSVRIADELHTALHNGGIDAPYILVGHAFGGDSVRTFADRYTSDVAGLVLVEADAVEFEPRAMQEEEHRREAVIVRRLRECREAVAQHKPLPMLPARPDRPPRTCVQQFFRGLPEERWSPQLNATLLELAKTKVAMYDAFASEMEQMPWDEEWLLRHRVSLGSRPVRVLTTGNHAVGRLPAVPNTNPKFLEDQRHYAAAQARWLELSSNSRQILARHSSEYVPFDEPDTLVDVIHEVHAAASMSDPAAPVRALAPGSAFRDCAECPEMVVMPAGQFTMGSSSAEKAWAATHGSNAKSVADEAPQHLVSLRSFALGRYDVTRGEYAAFVRETGYPAGEGCGRDSFRWDKQPDLNWEKPGFRQTDRDPVVCVSWQDAQAYLSWLNRKSGSRSKGGAYRLPSEAEWEYAARAGSHTRFWWGDDEGAADGHAWYKANSGGHTQPVGSKPANAFGLHDIVGDVWQWTQDCYSDNYANAPSDGSAAEAGGNCLRVDRGGSWLYPTWLLRSAVRERNPPDFRDVIMGFRVARTIP